MPMELLQNHLPQDLVAIVLLYVHSIIWTRDKTWNGRTWSPTPTHWLPDQANHLHFIPQSCKLVVQGRGGTFVQKANSLDWKRIRNTEERYCFVHKDGLHPVSVKLGPVTYVRLTFHFPQPHISETCSDSMHEICFQAEDHFHLVCVHNTLYLFGGVSQRQGPVAKDRACSYDLVTRQSFKLCKMPIGIGRGLCGVWKDRIYVFGGFTNEWGRAVNLKVLIYDTVQNKWTYGADWEQNKHLPLGPRRLRHLRLVLFQEKFIIFNAPKGMDNVYDLQIDMWELMDMPFPETEVVVPVTLP